MALALTPGTQQPWLTYGVRDPSVHWLTSNLAAAGVNIPVTDLYDWTVAEAIAQLQRDNGYWQSGEMDDETWGLINSVLTGTPVKPFSGTPPQQSPNAADYKPPPPPPTPQPAPAPAPTPAPPTIPTQAGRDALARLQSVLTSYGLGSLTQWITDKLIAGASETEIGLELYERPEFKARFPVIDQRRQAGLTPVNPTEVLAYEQQASQLFRAAGLPASFQTSSYAQTLMAKDVSAAELSSRIEDGFMRVTTAPPEVRSAFGQYFGATTDQAMAAIFLDPDLALPELEKKAMTAFVGGIGDRFKIDVAMQTAREIADTGLTEAAVWAGYRQLDELTPLFEETLTEGVDLKAEKEGVAAVFGTQPGQAAAVEQRRATRSASFKAGGGIAAAESGAYGAGTADK